VGPEKGRLSKLPDYEKVINVANEEKGGEGLHHDFAQKRGKFFLKKSIPKRGRY